MKNTTEMIEAYKNAIVGTLNINQQIQANITTEHNSHTNINPININVTNTTNNKFCKVLLVPMIWPNSKNYDKLYVKLEIVFEKIIMGWQETYNNEERITLRIENIINVIMGLIK